MTLPVRKRRPRVADPLSGIEQALRQYVVLSEAQYVAMTLWTAATHGIDHWENAPRLVFQSATKGCGKTRAMEVSREMSHSPLSVGGATTAALFRAVSSASYTIFHDEADTVWGGKPGPGAEDLRGFYNNGFGRDQPYLRCVGPKQKVVAFDTFAMAALATKGSDLPDTIMDRAVVIRMRKRAPGEQVKPLESRHKPELQKVGAEWAQWFELNSGRLATPETELSDRPADVWRPLLGIADLVGGRWPLRARNAAAELIANERDNPTEDVGLTLLHDIARLWPNDETRIHSWMLVRILANDDESDWDRHDYGRGISQSSLAKLLRPFQISPMLVRAPEPKQGYKLEQFEAVWERHAVARE